MFGFDAETIVFLIGYAVVAAPAALVAVLGVPSLLDWHLKEKTISKAAQAMILTGLAAAVSMLAVMLVQDRRHVVVNLGDWVESLHFHFAIKFVFDQLSVPFVMLTFVLSGTIAAFATRYLHRERGYNRFFALYALFVLGMIVASLAGAIETLFAGWELVGLSSALLVAFYQERSAPPRNGLWLWGVYRVSDAALLLAAVVLHHMAGGGDFDRMLGDQSWPEGHAEVTSQQALVVGLLLVIAAAGKSGLVPFSGWLPRAMEGPTPSSAIFYGALSIHLGVFLLLRMSPLIEASVWLAVVVVALGLSTAVLAYLVGSVQTDIKSALSFACLSQVGLIVAEIGLGLRYIALVHVLGHACLRTLQFIRAPSLLHDYHTLESAIGGHLPRPPVPVHRWVAEPARTWLYRWALERGYLDGWLADYVVSPFVRFFRWCDAAERAWTDWLTGQASRESDAVKAYSGAIEELV